MDNNDEYESVDQEDLDQDLQDDQLSDVYKFWTLTVAPGTEAELEEPEFDAVIRVTLVSFGVKVEKGSRSVLLVKDTSDEEKTAKLSPLCVLSQGTNECLSVDLRFDGPHTFAVKGTRPSAITLSGFLEPRAAAMGGPPGDLDPAMDMQRKMMMQGQGGDLDELPSDAEEDAESSSEEEPEPPKKKVRAAAKKGRKAAAGKKSSNGDDQPEPEPKAKASQPKPKKRKLNEMEVEPEQKTPSKSPSESAGKKKSKVMKPLKMGIMYRDIREGSGKPVKDGATVRVKYVGQLDDGSVFDKCLSTDGFSFTVGKGEVIKGWDVALVGLKVGAKRKIKIPPKLAYGAEGSEPNIPKNATLTFTIEVLGTD